MVKHKLLPALVIFVITFAVLYPQTASLAQHGDECMYIWKAAYYTTPPITAGADEYLSPGWNPLAFWALEQPFGSHLLYAAALKIFRVNAPSFPHNYGVSWYPIPEVAIPDATLPVVRITAMFMAALGLSLITFRLGWRGLLAGALFLAIPHVREDLARAWAEGPLLLGIGLCVLSYGTPWFTLAVGLATGFKLTAIVLWPVVWFTSPIKLAHMRSLLNIIVASFLYAITTPYSWLAGGPAYLVFQLVYRLREFLSQSARTAEIVGPFPPTRYLWPLELAALLGIVHVVKLIYAKRTALLP